MMDGPVADASPSDDRRVRIAVIGAGAGGICVTKDLLDAGFDDVVVLERNAGVGGTWLINRYPGCECDVQSALYSFSWAPKPDWSKPYGTQPEILDYLRGLAASHDVLSHCRFGVTVTGAAWDPGSATWRITTSSGDDVEAEVLVAAVGMFREPSLPDIEGIGTFAGAMFHSARWDVDHDLTGRAGGRHRQRGQCRPAGAAGGPGGRTTPPSTSGRRTGCSRRSTIRTRRRSSPTSGTTPRSRPLSGPRSTSTWTPA